MTCGTEGRHEVEVHELKTWPEYFRDVKRGFKLHEIRENDRDYSVGDLLVLREWIPMMTTRQAIREINNGEYTGDVVFAVITNIVVGEGALDGILAEGFVALSIKVLPHD